MTNSQSPAWIESALAFWTNTTPAKCGKSRKIIRWNIEQLTKMQERLA